MGAAILHRLLRVSKIRTASSKGISNTTLIWRFRHDVIAASAGRCFTNIGNAAHATGDLDQALRNLLRGLRVYQKSYGNNHPAVAVSQANLAEVYKSKGNAEQAEQCLQRATAIRAYLAPTVNPNR